MGEKSVEMLYRHWGQLLLETDQFTSKFLKTFLYDKFVHLILRSSHTLCYGVILANETGHVGLVILAIILPTNARRFFFTCTIILQTQTLEISKKGPLMVLCSEQHSSNSSTQRCPHYRCMSRLKRHKYAIGHFQLFTIFIIKKFIYSLVRDNQLIEIDDWL